jgi:hypothetical protein
VCGPGDAPAELTASGAGVTLVYGNFLAGANNDCPPTPNASVVSLTIAAEQSGGIGRFTLCIERPDQLGVDAALGPDTVGTPARVPDANGSANGCMLSYRLGLPAPRGVVRGIGVCSAGVDPAGFALEVDGVVTVERVCGGTIDQIELAIAGRVAVAAE